MKRRHRLFRWVFSSAISRGQRFARDEKGVTAVEFGILAVPFFTIIFAIIETAMVFFAGQVLESAVEDASRMIKTGQAHEAGYDLGSFRHLLCSYTFNLFDCQQVKIKVTKITNFGATTTTNSVQLCDNLVTRTCEWSLVDSYEAGAPRDVIQVFAYYRWPLLVVLPYFNLKNQPDNFRLLGATRVFRNEPFTEGPIE